MKTFLLALTLLLPATSLAAALSQSIGGNARTGDFSADALSQAPVTEAQPLASASRSAARSCGCFEIFSLWVDQSVDLDNDAYYQKLSVEFDADTTSTQETVYAKLYLRDETGPWELYSETGLFDIHLDSGADRYRIDTNLLEGYPPGRYELMIELYALNHAGVVASRITSFDHRGDLLYLEDEIHDQPAIEVVVVTPPPSSGGVIIAGEGAVAYAGSLSPGWLLIGLLMLAIRHLLARKPRT